MRIMSNLKGNRGKFRNDKSYMYALRFTRRPIPDVEVVTLKGNRAL